MNERSGLSGIEVAILVGAAVLGGAGGIVWLGAALAAAVAGHRLQGGLTEAIHALPQMKAHLDQPRLAWRVEADRSALPGPGLYWGCTALVLLVLLALTVAAWRGWKSMSERGRVRLGVDTRARFATLRDLAPLVVKRPVPDSRFVLGSVHGQLVATEDRRAAEADGRRQRASYRQGDRGSVAVIGPSRSGKTVNVISSLLEWTGPAVVVSVKRDLIDATRTAREVRGTCRVFDPSGVAGMSPQTLARWSPLRAATTPRGAQKAAAALAAAIPRNGVDGGGDYWVKQAEILLTGLLGAAALDPTRSMSDVAEWVFAKLVATEARQPDGSVVRQGNEITDLLAGLRHHESPEVRTAAGMAMLHLDAVWSLDERVLSSVYATVQTVVQAWLDPAVALSSTPSATGTGGYVDLDWLTDAEEARTLYLVAPLDDQERLAPVLGGLLGDLKDQAYQRDVAGDTLTRPLLMVIDEAGNMPLAWLPEVAATCAGIGILLVTIWQSKAQLDAAYGRLSDSVLTNHLTKIVFSGCSDQATLDYISRLLGDEDVQRRSTSFDLGGSGRRSVSESTHREALTPFHLLRQVRPGEAVLIHGTLPPAHLQARLYWKDRHLQRLRDGEASGRPTWRPSGEPSVARQRQMVNVDESDRRRRRGAVHRRTG